MRGPTTSTTHLVLGIGALVTLALGGSTLAAAAAPADLRSPACSAFLAENVGGQGMTITTESPEAQRLFGQGLTLSYAFNHNEAARSFRAAIAEDPTCAMCGWGLALVMGPNINAPMRADLVPAAYQAVRHAMALRARASERERAFIEALARRYAPKPVDDRSALDRDYAHAMREVARRFPSDLDAAALSAEALMDTSPWDYWGEDGRPTALTTELLGTLERVLAVAPDHIGANHFYVHAVESVRPRLGVAAADRLGALAPDGAGHLLHMPSHIYARLGRYHDASSANEQAIRADRRYLEACRVEGFYATMYVPHNYAFLVATRSLEGRSEDALETARELAALVEESTAMSGHGADVDAEQFSATPWLVMVRFGRWAELLAAPAPPPEHVYATGLWHYARGVAFARTMRLDDASTELDELRIAATDPSLRDRMLMQQNSAASVLAIALEEASGELAAARGDDDGAIAHLTTAVRQQDDLRYMEPPPWHRSVRVVLGSVLLEAGRLDEAERVFREDLERFPDSGWALFGVRKSLLRQHRDAEAAAIGARLARAWGHADVLEPPLGTGAPGRAR